ncbi:hypothetical protein GPECTOR_1839g911 [Gonium pectorale]|uniref:Protein HIRA-like C-terminal domain-containing protein n=1 Tax=Gonium pectorale TaxID=33097 RepID=A0A150FUZ7_GONPE|nr:hypothetical protein GPECTOR_1839g911 [Gonium pectorale]|eukprot:KXZ40850.1 hypothetical protein GPECTOR_1839g911 [Gonium pectorale]
MAILIHAQSAAPGEPQVPLELQALNTGRDARNRPAAELVCLAGSARRWADTLPGQVVALAGSSRLVAVSTTFGDLMVRFDGIYSSAGRRLFPPIRLGHPAAFLAVAPGSATLLALTADGKLRVWDFATSGCLLETSVAPLLAPGGGGQPLRVAAARLASCGSPLVVLSNAHAYVHHAGLRCWMRVVDDAFPISQLTTSVASAAP